MFNSSLYIDELRLRLNNPAIPDAELTVYLVSASRQVNPDGWTNDEYTEMIINSACQLLLVDNKFPEIQSVSSQGVSTSFSGANPNRFKEKLAALREGYWLRNL